MLQLQVIGLVMHRFCSCLSTQGLLGASHCSVSGRGRMHSSHSIGRDKERSEVEKQDAGRVSKGDGQCKECVLGP